MQQTKGKYFLSQQIGLNFFLAFKEYNSDDLETFYPKKLG